MPLPPEVHDALERQRIARERHVARGGLAGPQRCPRCRGNGRIEMLEHCPTCRGKGEVNWSLDWLLIGTDGTATAGDGRYLIRPVRTGFVAIEFERDMSFRRQSGVMTWDEARKWCEQKDQERTKARI